MTDIEKIAADRYRLRAHGQVITLSAKDILRVMEYALTHRPQLDQEAKAAQEYQETQDYMEHHYLGGE